MRLFLLYKRRWWLFYAPVLFCATTALWWSVTHWFALPPSKAVITAGSPKGSYARLAQRYAQKLEGIGMNIDVVYSGNESGELERLLSPADTASIGFAHGVYAKSTPGLQALAVIDSEPVWIFSTLNGPTSVKQAAGVRIAAGGATSPSFLAAQLILAHAGVRESDVRFQPQTGIEAGQALLDGKVDMAVATAGDDAQLIEMLTRQGGVQVLGIEQAGALASRQSVLQPILLPEGSLELGNNLPPRDVTMASMQTHLLVKPSVHPALQRALMNAAVEIHEEPTFLQRHGQFPTYSSSDFPLSPVAKAYSQGNRRFMETLLPYRTAQLAELFLFAVIPILAVTIFVLAWIPRWFDWRVNSALHHFYGDLKFLETEMESVATSNPMGLRALIERLDAIEQRVVKMELPDAFSDRWYTLREHLSAAQERMFKLRSR
jgi:NMT1/THI5 like